MDFYKIKSRRKCNKLSLKWCEYYIFIYIFKRPLWDACLCMGELQAPPAPHFVFLITL